MHWRFAADVFDKLVRHVVGIRHPVVIVSCPQVDCKCNLLEIERAFSRAAENAGRSMAARMANIGKRRNAQMPKTMPEMALPRPRSMPFESLILMKARVPMARATMPQRGTHRKERMPNTMAAVAMPDLTGWNGCAAGGAAT